MLFNEKQCVLWSLFFLYNWKVCTAEECKPYEESDITKNTFQGCEKRRIPHGSMCYYREQLAWKGNISCDKGYNLKDFGNPSCVYDVFSTQWSWNTMTLYSTCELIKTARTPPKSTTSKDSTVPTSTNVVTEYASQHDNSSSSVSSTSVIRNTSESDKEEVNPVVINICVAIATSVVTAIVLTAIHCARNLYRKRRQSSSYNDVLSNAATTSPTVPNARCIHCEEAVTDSNPAAVYIDLPNRNADEVQYEVVT